MVSGLGAGAGAGGLGTLRTVRIGFMVVGMLPNMELGSCMLGMNVVSQSELEGGASAGYLEGVRSSEEFSEKVLKRKLGALWAEVVAAAGGE